MLVDVTSMIASVGSSIFGSGTVSTRTSRLPCQVTAFTCTPRIVGRRVRVGQAVAHRAVDQVLCGRNTRGRNDETLATGARVSRFGCRCETLTVIDSDREIRMA